MIDDIDIHDGENIPVDVVATAVRIPAASDSHFAASGNARNHIVRSEQIMSLPPGYRKSASRLGVSNPLNYEELSQWGKDED